jgi:lysophospholipase L1-like esterase
MRRRVVAASLVACLLLVGGVLWMLRPWQPARHSLRIVAIGDSLTVGFVPGSPPDGGVTPRTAGWRKRFVERLTAAGVDVEMVGPLANGDFAENRHYAVSGITINGLTEMLAARPLAPPLPDLILVMAGTNDAATPPAYAGAPDRLGRLLDDLTTQAPAATILVSTLLPAQPASIQDGIAAFNAELPRVVAQRPQVRLVEVGSRVPMEHLPDGIHPDAWGYQQMADGWADAVLAVLRERRQPANQQ